MGTGASPEKRVSGFELFSANLNSKGKKKKTNTNSEHARAKIRQKNTSAISMQGLHYGTITTLSSSAGIHISPGRL